jgi:hypothetical protein
MNRIAYLYLLRVPILLGIIMFVFPFAALWPGSPLQPLFENLYSLDFWGTAITTMLSAVLAWSLLLTVRIILFNGSERFGTDQFATAQTMSLWSAFGVLLLAAPMMLGQFFRRDVFGLAGKAFWMHLLSVVVGLMASYVLAYLAMLLAVLTAPMGTQVNASSFPGPSMLQQLLEDANSKTLIPASWWTKSGGWLANHVPNFLKAGFLDSRVNLPAGTPNPGFGLPYPGHWLAFTFAFASGIVCVIIDIYKTTYLGEDTFLPALLFVLILLLALNSILSLASFFFDRFRIPLLIPLILVASLGTHSPSSDHYFQIVHGAAVPEISPGAALEAKYQRRLKKCRATAETDKSFSIGADTDKNLLTTQKRQDPNIPEKDKTSFEEEAARRCALATPFIVVTTAGGGIQAASWTTQVLIGLEGQSRIWNQGSFADSVVLISSVSGGATGSMFFLHQYDAPHDVKQSGFKLRPEEFGSLVTLASQSSLEDIAWALVYRDIPRILLPYGKTEEQRLLDRGRMLEVNWQQRANLHARLSQWKLGVAEGWRPAAIFNSTIAETGEPLLFQTTEFQKKALRKADGTPIVPDRRSFYDFLQGADVPVVTAVRLAATFPYVTPAARPAVDGPQNHLIDGGYYDNFGVASAVEWIDEALKDFTEHHTELEDIAKSNSEVGPKILILQIRSFPDDHAPPPRNRGWFYQLLAPVDGILGARTTAQLVRDHDDLLRLQKLYWGAKYGKLPIIRFAGFKFTSPDAPLSWSMTEKQIQAIKDEWQTILTPPKDRPKVDDLQQVECLFNSAIRNDKGPTGKTCDELATTKEPW